MNERNQWKSLATYGFIKSEHPHNTRPDMAKAVITLQASSMTCNYPVSDEKLYSQT